MNASAVIRCIAILMGLPWIQGRLAAEPTETFRIQSSPSRSKTIVYVRNVRFDQEERLYHVQDFFENGQLQMDATYSSFDNQHIKEEYQCNYGGNVKEGRYREWHENGNLRYVGHFKHGLRDGVCREFSINGHQETEAVWKSGMLNGTARFWAQHGEPPLTLKFRDGINLDPRQVKYRYIAYTPKDYEDFPEKRWPLIVYLHGGSGRGTNLTKLYAAGVPDQIHRGRELPFIVVAPQCPLLMRWSTDDWFETFFEEVAEQYRVDTNRVYLTGVSLGGAGTWYLAAKYPDVFAAIAPISGFTSRSIFLDQHLDQLAGLPIWAFHGERDVVVPVSESLRMIEALEDKNPRFKFTIEPDTGHWVHWSVYPGDALYEWFLQQRRRVKP